MGRRKNKTAQVTVDIDPQIMVDALQKQALSGDIDGSSFTPTPENTTPTPSVEVHQPEQPTTYGGPWGVFWHPAYGWMPGHLRHRLKKPRHHHADVQLCERPGCRHPISDHFNNGTMGCDKCSCSVYIYPGEPDVGNEARPAPPNVGSPEWFRGGSLHLAHDSGDNETVYHCPFCGSGAVMGRSDGSAECEFCSNVFTVQVQPRHPNMPQTINGQPMQQPGMGAPHPPPWAEQPGTQYAPPDDSMAYDEVTSAEQQQDLDQEQIPDFLRMSTRFYPTPDGVALTEEQFIKRTALQFADDPAALAEQMRSE
jgi:hypothetical protein